MFSLLLTFFFISILVVSCFPYLPQAHTSKTASIKTLHACNHLCGNIFDYFPNMKNRSILLPLYPKERVHTLMAAIIVKFGCLGFLLERVVNTSPDLAVITQFTTRYTWRIGPAAELYGKQCQKLFSRVKKVRVSSLGTRSRKSRFYTRERRLTHIHTHSRYKKLVTTPLVVTVP